jgi:Scramblase
LSIYDIYGHEAITLHRPPKVIWCCCTAFQKEIEISAPPGTLVGNVEHGSSILAKITVKNVAGMRVFKIKELFSWNFCADAEFKVQLISLC